MSELDLDDPGQPEDPAAQEARAWTEWLDRPAEEEEPWLVAGLE